MSQTLFLRNVAADACANTGALGLSQGNTLAEINVADAKNWDGLLGQSIQAGTWTVVIWVNVVTTGGGPAARVTIRVRRLNSSCGVVATLHEEQTGNLSAGAITEVIQIFSPGQVNFAAGDFLLVEVQRTNSSREVRVRYNSSTGLDQADSRITFPDFVPLGTHFYLGTGEKAPVYMSDERAAHVYLGDGKKIT